MDEKDKLIQRYKLAVSKILKYRRTVERARQRKFYYERVALRIEERLDLLKNGQTEFNLEEHHAQ